MELEDSPCRLVLEQQRRCAPVDLSTGGSTAEHQGPKTQGKDQESTGEGPGANDPMEKDHGPSGEGPRTQWRRMRGHGPLEKDQGPWTQWRRTKDPLEKDQGPRAKDPVENGHRVTVSP